MARSKQQEMGLNSGEAFMPAQRAREIHQLMVRTRVLEERMIKMSKSGEGYFWIGGPGEEAFSTCLGLQVKKGQGPEFDYLHLKYRSSAIVMAMGAEMNVSLRQMAMTKTDHSSWGRNFTSHFCIREWNIVPVNSVIAVQFAVAPGTAHVQKRSGGDGVTIVVGGDAGTAEGDFATCMIWSTRPNERLPVLMIVMNNGWGISTAHCNIHACENIIERGKAFGIPGEIVDGNDPVASWDCIQRAMHYCRTERQPFMIEARVSRLFGHSSSSGAPRDAEAVDCIDTFEKRLLQANLMDQASIEAVHTHAKAEVESALQAVLQEARPVAEDVEVGTYAPSEVDRVYPRDYTGLPGA